MIARPFQIEDKEKIVELLCSDGTWPAKEIGVDPLKYWEWKYLRNPMGHGIICVVKEGDKIISHAAAIPMFICVKGRVVLASQGVDVFTNRAFRHKNAAMLAIKCRNEQRERMKFKVDLAFTSDRAHADFARRSGHKEIGIIMDRYELILKPSSFFDLRFSKQIKKVLYERYIRFREFSIRTRIARKAGAKIVPVSNFDESVNDLIASTMNRFDLIIFKDDKYLNWRFADKDAGEFKILLAQKEGKNLGYVVFKLVKNETAKHGEIADILTRPGFEDVTVMLLLEAIRSLASEGAISVYCWLPRRHPYASSLKKVGFLRVKIREDQSMIILYHDRSGEKILQALTQEKNKKAHFVLGDSDWI